MTDTTISTPAVNESAKEIQVAATPTIHLLPLSIGALANHAKDNGSRFALNGVRVEFGPDRTYTATVTDTKVLVHVEGECGDADEFPDSCIPALAHAPNGATSAMIPASFWRESFKKAKTLTRRTRKDVLRSLAVVTGPTSTTMAATDLEKSQCDSSPNIEGKFPPYQDIIKKTREKGKYLLKIALCPRLLSDLLSTISQFSDDDSSRAEFEIRFDLPDPEPETEELEVEAAEGEEEAEPKAVEQKPIVIEHPILVNSKSQAGKLTGLIMPLAG